MNFFINFCSYLDGLNGGQIQIIIIK